MPKFRLNSLEILNYTCTIQPTPGGRGISMSDGKDVEKSLTHSRKETSFWVRGRPGHYSVGMLGNIMLPPRLASRIRE